MTTSSHFHIRWKEQDRFDWQRFDDPASAVRRASELVQSGETFSVEAFNNDDCPHCRDMRGRFL